MNRALASSVNRLVAGYQSIANWREAIGISGRTSVSVQVVTGAAQISALKDEPVQAVRPRRWAMAAGRGLVSPRVRSLPRWMPW